MLVTVGPTVGHHSGASNSASPMARRPDHRSVVGGIEDESRPVVSVPLARSAKLHVHRRRDHVEHAVQQCPEIVGEGTAGPICLHCRDHRQFGDEAVVVEGHLSIDAAREGVARQLLLENPCGLLGPARALGEPVKGERRHQEAGGFGDDVIVGRRSPTAERSQGSAGATRSGQVPPRCARRARLLPPNRRADGAPRPR